MIDMFGETYNRRTPEPIWIGLRTRTLREVEIDPTLTMVYSESGGRIIDEHLLHWPPKGTSTSLPISILLTSTSTSSIPSGPAYSSRCLPLPLYLDCPDSIRQPFKSIYYSNHL